MLLVSFPSKHFSSISGNSVSGYSLSFFFNKFGENFASMPLSAKTNRRIFFGKNNLLSSRSKKKKKHDILFPEEVVVKEEPGLEKPREKVVVVNS